MLNPYLITNYKFKESEFLIKLFTDINNSLELVLVHNISKDEWRGFYNCSYIENMTQKTGNYKQFDIFVTMLSAGLLNTSDSIKLELLTFKDLKELHHNKTFARSERIDLTSKTNKRYLILTYTVEFDEINYPLPLEYIGPPDPKTQQKIIYKLESRLRSIKQILQNGKTETAVINKLKMENKNLNAENILLKQKLKTMQSNTKSKKNMILQKALIKLEKSITLERETHHQLVQKLRLNNSRLKQELNITKRNEKILLTKLKENSDVLRSINRNYNYGNKTNAGGEHGSRKLTQIYPRKTRCHSESPDGVRTSRRFSQTNSTKSRSHSQSSNSSRKSIFTLTSDKRSRSSSVGHCYSLNSLQNFSCNSASTRRSCSLRNLSNCKISSSSNSLANHRARSKSLENTKNPKLKNVVNRCNRSMSIQEGLKKQQQLSAVRKLF